mmetsp:Transcript_28330/g.38338  ORF Transcript_28330/g.38338 Transcript_28330/m.38338 type:complete len:131 (-) Transcript_28330:172-564(-)
MRRQRGKDGQVASLATQRGGCRAEGICLLRPHCAAAPKRSDGGASRRQVRRRRGRRDTGASHAPPHTPTVVAGGLPRAVMAAMCEPFLSDFAAICDGVCPEEFLREASAPATRRQRMISASFSFTAACSG